MPGTTFDNETLLAALQGQGGPGINGATEILLRAGVAALLDSTSLSGYPLTSAQVISEVNTALASGDRATILAEATRLDQFNNAGSCPLS